MNSEHLTAAAAAAAALLHPTFITAVTPAYPGLNTTASSYFLLFFYISPDRIHKSRIPLTGRYYKNTVRVYRFTTEYVNYKVGKKRGHRLLAIILSNLNRFTKFFHLRFLGKFADKCILNIPPHIAYVATLLCKTLGLTSAKQAINDKLQGSVDVVWWGC